MKRILLVLVTTILLFGCNSIHENIDEKMAQDVDQILKIYDTAIKEERSFNDDERFILEDFQLLYGAKAKADDLTEEEGRLFILVDKMIDLGDVLVLKESSRESYKSQKKLIKSVLESGTIYGD